MKKENLQILDSIEDIETLKLIKGEAEMVLEECLNSESIIINKANNIFQILIVILISITGFLISKFPLINYKEHIVIMSLIIILASGLSIWKLSKIIFPNEVSSKGAVPSVLLQPDIIVKGWEELSILRNRIYSLESAIKRNKISQSEKVKAFKNAINFLMIGISLVTIYSLLITF